MVGDGAWIIGGNKQEERAAIKLSNAVTGISGPTMTEIEGQPTG